MSSLGLALPLVAVLAGDPEAADLSFRTGAPVVQARAAIDASTGMLPPELLLAIAYSESRFRPRAGPDGLHPRDWRRARRRKGWRVYVCGVMQTMAHTRAECRDQRDVRVDYAVGVRELEAWVRICRSLRRPTLSCVVTGHAHGTIRARDTGDSRYARKILRRMRRYMRPDSGKETM